MSPQKRTVIYRLIVLSSVLFACAGLPAFGTDEEAADIAFGPQLSATEHQTGVFEDVLKHMQENYVYYESSQMDWASLRETYLDEINKGLTTAEFEALMTQFEAEFAQGEVVYVSREERIQADTAVNTPTYGGIGAFVSFQAEDVPHVVILDVMPGSPAEKSGLRAHDSIYAVDGEEVRLEEGGDVVLRIRGDAGTTVSLTVQSPGGEKREIEIIRAPLTGLGKVKASELPDADIGYILMPTTLPASPVEEIAAALETFSQNSELKGVILDLRISNSGTNWPIEEMLALFLDNATIDIYSRSQSEPYHVNGQNLFGSQEIPLVVLVGEHTSGLPELFAAAVQSTGRGIVIGSNTEGNIEALNAYPLSNGGQILIASASFRVSGEEELGLHGFQPEVRVEARWDEILPEADPVLEQAILSLEVQE